MGEYLTDIVEWMSSLPVLWAYVIILVISYGENVLPPIPGDMIIVFGGYLVGIGRLDVIPVIVLSTIGGSAGFMTMYAVGHRIGRHVLQRRGTRWIPIKRLDRAREMLARWGHGLILANRFLPGLRSVISLSVGMAHMPAGRTTMFASFSALAWSGLLIGLGFYLGDHWEQVSEYLKNYGWAVTTVIVCFVAIQLFLSYRGTKSKGKVDDEPRNPEPVLDEEMQK